jgi:hypothetical protein
MLLLSRITLYLNLEKIDENAHLPQAYLTVLKDEFAIPLPQIRDIVKSCG